MASGSRPSFARPRPSQQGRLVPGTPPPLLDLAPAAVTAPFTSIHTHTQHITLQNDDDEHVSDPFLLPLSPFPELGGSWSFYHQGLNPMKFGVRWRDVGKGVQVIKIVVRLSTHESELHRGVHDIREGQSATESYTGTLGQSASLVLKVTATLRGEDDAVPAAPAALRPKIQPKILTPKELAELWSGSLENPVVGDVRFSFPDGHALCASSKALIRASSHFATLLGPGFAESIPTTNPRKTFTPSIASSSSFDDSDDDASDSEPDGDASTKSNGTNPPLNPTLPSHFHHIAVSSNTSYTTYRAVLCWILTSHIAFAPLTSSFPLSVSPTRRAYLTSYAASSPSLPLPTSSKSAFRLADFLDLDPLESLALEAIRQGLSVENAAEELFSDVSRVYRRSRTLSWSLSWIIGKG